MRTTLAMLVALAAITGCSSDDDPESSQSSSNSEPISASTNSTATSAPTATSATTDSEQSEVAVIEERAKTYVSALLSGDGATGYALLSQRCRDNTPLSEFAAISEQAAETYGLVDFTIDSVRIVGDKAEVNGTTGIPALDEAAEEDGFNWVREEGEWFNDKCG